MAKKAAKKAGKKQGRKPPPGKKAKARAVPAAPPPPPPQTQTQTQTMLARLRPWPLGAPVKSNTLEAAIALAFLALRRTACRVELISERWESPDGIIVTARCQVVFIDRAAAGVDAEAEYGGEFWARLRKTAGAAGEGEFTVLATTPDPSGVALRADLALAPVTPPAAGPTIEEAIRRYADEKYYGSTERLSVGPPLERDDGFLVAFHLWTHNPFHHFSCHENFIDERRGHVLVRRSGPPGEPVFEVVAAADVFLS